MSVDIEKLKELAGQASEGPWQTELAYPIVQPAYPARGAICSALTWPDARFIAAANPAAVLELIADQKRMASRLLRCTACAGQGEVYSGRTTYEGYNQPPEPIMHKCGECDGDGVLGDADECLSILDELQQLKAENEALRKDAERYRWFRAQHWDSSVICAVADPKLTTKLGAYCPSGKLLDDAVDAGISMSKEASHD